MYIAVTGSQKISPTETYRSNDMAGYLHGDYYGAYPQQPPAPIGFELHDQTQPSNPSYPPRNDIYPAQYGQSNAQQSYATPYQPAVHQPSVQDYSHGSGGYDQRGASGLPPVGFESVRYPENEIRGRERPAEAACQRQDKGD